MASRPQINLDTQGIIEQRGSGVNKFRATGSTFLGWIQFQMRETDPDTSTWGEDEAGRTWFNTTSKTLKIWEGENVREVAFT